MGTTKRVELDRVIELLKKRGPLRPAGFYALRRFWVTLYPHYSLEGGLRKRWTRGALTPT